MAEFKLPSASQRLSVFGKTGSGKTQGGIWVLSQMPYDKMPYVVMDFKYDELIGDIEYAEEISLKKVPKQPGLYVVHPRPDEKDEVEKFLWKMWEQEKTGLFVDEGYMIDRYSPALSSILTQGRSKKIPGIILSQRPKLLNPFVISEADIYMTYYLNDKNDQKRIQEFYPPSVDLRSRLPDYHSRWYDVKQDALFQLKPVPDRDSILQVFNDRLKPKRKRF